MTSRVSMIPREIESKWLDADRNVHKDTSGAGSSWTNALSMLRKMQIASPTKKAMIWVFVADEANKPIALYEAASRMAPRYPPMIGPRSGLPKMTQGTT